VPGRRQVTQLARGSPAIQLSATEPSARSEGDSAEFGGKVEKARGRLACHRQRNLVERMFCRRKDWRRIAMRFDRNLHTFFSAVALAAAVIW